MQFIRAHIFKGKEQIILLYEKQMLHSTHLFLDIALIILNPSGNRNDIGLDQSRHQNK